MRLAIALLLCAFAWVPRTLAAPSWSRVHLADGESAVVAVASDPSAPTRIVAATPSALYVSIDEGRHWHAALRLPGKATMSQRAIASDAATMLAATDQGLYGSFDGGARWSRVFRGHTDQERQCTQIAFHPHRPGTILVGTRGGLFLTTDRGQRWTPIPTPSTAREIIALAFTPHEADTLYVLATQGLFVGDLVIGQWQQRRTTAPLETQEPPTLEEEPADAEEVGTADLTTVAADPKQPSTLYLGTFHGVERSTDAGVSWQPLTSDGLESSRIQRLLVDASAPSVIYAATARGVASFDSARDRWQLITEGVFTTRIHDLALTQHTLWAATDQGLYRYDLASTASTVPLTPAQESLNQFVDEPTIGQVREAAIRYAEVHPDKIALWRTQARLKSLLPDVSVSGGTNLTDFRHWDSGSNPDSLLRGERDIDWSASLTWELADLIWSTDQTSIDSRSKLMVELRNDVIDEVTRLYFERRRLQLQLAANPPSDPQTRREKELRLQELAALIDGLTNGFFSRHDR